jgi:2,3-bisphosphoglycerate-dependent phosphoglycerate mutase
VESVILARHGESDYSARSLLNGDPTIACGLTAAGVAQAQRLGAELGRCEFDLCVTSEFERARLTARAALAGREVPTLVLAELNDPRYGIFEGELIEEYRRWAAGSPSTEPAPGGGESRFAIVERYARGLAALLARPEGSILVVAHSLPVAYALAAAAGEPPRPRTELVEYATPYPLDRGSLERATAVLEAWLAGPDW